MTTYCEPCKRHYKSLKPHLKTKKHLSNLLIHNQHNDHEELNDYIETECSICLDNILLHDLHITPCKHHFHNNCIRNWMNLNNNCPNCRQHFHIIPPRPIPQPFIRPIQPPIPRPIPQPFIRPIQQPIQQPIHIVDTLLDTILLFQRMNLGQNIILDFQRRLDQELNRQD